MKDDIAKIQEAWFAEARNRHLLPSPERDLQKALVPDGGEWVCVAPAGAITRAIIWGQIEVAILNPAGDLLDGVEGDIAMGMRATPLMDKALRVISFLAIDPENLGLIQRIARSAIGYVEMPAPRFPYEEDEGEEDQAGRS